MYICVWVVHMSIVSTETRRVLWIPGARVTGVYDHPILAWYMGDSNQTQVL